MNKIIVTESENETMLTGKELANEILEIVGCFALFKALLAKRFLEMGGPETALYHRDPDCFGLLQ